MFALTKQMLDNPPPDSTATRKRLLRSINAIFLFVIHPSAPLDASNPRTRPSKGQSGGALRPAYWHADLRSKGTIARGQPPKTVLGRKRRADVTIECLDRDFVDMATGKRHASALFNGGRIKIKGSIDLALRIAELISYERSKIYGTVPGAPSAAQSITSREEEDYSDGAPAPVSDFKPQGVKARL